METSETLPKTETHVEMPGWVKRRIEQGTRKSPAFIKDFPVVDIPLDTGNLEFHEVERAFDRDPQEPQTPYLKRQHQARQVFLDSLQLGSERVWEETEVKENWGTHTYFQSPVNAEIFRVFFFPPNLQRGYVATERLIAAKNLQELDVFIKEHGQHVLSQSLNPPKSKTGIIGKISALIGKKS